MLFTTQRTATATLLALTLSACGGGGGGGDNGGGGGGGGGTPATPQASSGYAQPTDEIRRNVKFNLPQGTWIRREDDVVTRHEPTVSVDFSGENLRQIYVTYDGERHVAQTQSVNGGDFYILQSKEDGRIIRLTFDRQLTSSSNVVQGGVAGISNPEYNDYFAPLNFIESSFIVYGFDTDPTTISAETGTARYDGAIRVSGYQDGIARGASGNMSMTANFTDDTVSGSFNLGSMSGLTGAESYEMESTAITGNGFSGNISVVGSLQPGQTLQDAEYQGNFYGSDAEAVGGTIDMTIQDGAESPIFIQGGFVADEVAP